MSFERLRSALVVTVLLTTSAAANGCFLARDVDACQTQQDCGAGSVCWNSSGIMVCLPEAFAACLDRGTPQRECLEAFDDAGTADAIDDPDLGVAEDVTDAGLGDAAADTDLDRDPDTPGDGLDVGGDDAPSDVPFDVSEDPRDAADIPGADQAGDMDVATDPDIPTDRDALPDADMPEDPDAEPALDMDADPNLDQETEIPPTPPEAAPDTYNLVGGAALTVPNPGVLDNDTSFGGPLTAVEETSTSNGSLTLGAGGGFTYIHDGSQTTADSFTYRAVDDGVTSAAAIVTLLVNIAPIASDQGVMVPDGDTMTVTLEATDANDDDLTFAIGDTPLNGELTNFDTLAGTVDYTADPGYTGTDEFTFLANDGALDSNEATVTLSINGAPGFISLPPMQSTLADRTLGPLSITIDDPDDALADLTVSATSDRQDIVPDANIAVAGSGQDRSLTLITEPDTAGVVTIDLELSDGLNVVTAAFTVHVGVTNDIDDAAVHGSIRRALDIALSGDTITFDPDHFNVEATEDERTITLASQLVIDRDLTIEGPGQGLLILSGDDAVRVIYVSESVQLNVSDLTVSNGNASGTGEEQNGGGIYNDGGSVSLTTITLVDNVCDGTGAGLHNAAGDLTILDSIVSGNSTSSGGGGISNAAVGEVTVTNSELSSNLSSGNGGGVTNIGQLIVSRSTLSGNSAGGSGGGILNGGAALVSDTVLSGNSAEGSGGGIRNNLNGVATITNSTLTGNWANASGGGIYNQATSVGRVVVTNSTLFACRADADNDGSGTGGGIRQFSGTFALRGTIVAANRRGSGPGSPDDLTNELSAPLEANSAYNLISDADSADILTDGLNGNIVGVDWTTVISATLADNGGPTLTHALLISSPGINAIPTAQCDDAEGAPLSSDQRGLPRPSGGACDIGSFERQPTDP